MNNIPDKDEGNIPLGDEAREAVDALRGYLYQAVASAIAWVKLPSNGRLYLEVADDYATVVGSKLTSVQVKDTKLSGSITLNNQGVKDAIKNFVKLVRDNPSLDVYQHFLSTSLIGVENKRDQRIDGKAGLEYWRDAAVGSDLAPLRAYLQSDRVDETVRSFCKGRNDEELRADLVARLSWHVGSPPYDGLFRDLENLLIEYGYSHENLSPSEAIGLVYVVIYAVLRCSINRERTQRVLTRADLLRIIEPITHISIPKNQIKSLIANMPSLDNRALDDVGWQALNFGEPRGWRPALLGQALVPADALTCPQLPEVNIIIDRLGRDYFVNVFGEPGSGKSICAFQVAHHFHSKGWQVFQQFSSAHLLAPVPSAINTLYLVDDAHLLAVSTLQSLIQLAGRNTQFLFLHNALKDDFINAPRHTLYINAIRAVRTIAAYVRANPFEVLTDVQELDKDIGLRTLDISLERRVDEAEGGAEYPWQFCFILSGGWRRATEAIEGAQNLGAELTLAAVAIYQLVSRDARPSLESLKNIANAGGLQVVYLERHLQWLVQQRWVISSQDIRYPHQRFALVVLIRLLSSTSPECRHSVGCMVAHTMANPDMPMLGKRNLFRELRFEHWHHLIPVKELEAPWLQCWLAKTPSAIAEAAFFLADTDDYLKAKGVMMSEEHYTLIANWLNTATSVSAYAIGYLLNDLRNRDENSALNIIKRSDPAVVGKIISEITPKTAYSIGYLLQCLASAKSTEWGGRFAASLNRDLIRDSASTWGDHFDDAEHDMLALSSINKYLRGLQWADESFALDICEVLTPFIQRVLRDNAAEGFNCIHDVCWFLLRFFSGWKMPDDFQPGERHFKIANDFLGKLDVNQTADQLSQLPLAGFQNSAYFLGFVRSVNRPLFEQLVTAMDWSAITNKIGSHWSGLPHEAEILLGVCWCKVTQSAIEKAVIAHRDKIEILPGRLALMFPDLAWRHLGANKVIDLKGHWGFGAGVIAMTADEKPEFLQVLIEPHLHHIADSLSRVQHSNDLESLRFLNVLSEASPDQWEKLMTLIDVSSASTVWRTSLKSTSGIAYIPLFLINCCLHRDDALGELARVLNNEFPGRKTSEQLLLEVAQEDLSDEDE